MKHQRKFDQNSIINRSKIEQHRPKIDLGGFWAPKCVFGRILGGSWSGLEASWRLRWAILRRLGMSRRRPGGILGPSWRILEASCRPRCAKMSQHSEMMPQDTKKYRKPYKTNGFLRFAGRSWRHLGGKMGYLEASWRHLGASWRVLEASCRPR